MMRLTLWQTAAVTGRWGWKIGYPGQREKLGIDAKHDTIDEALESAAELINCINILTETRPKASWQVWVSPGRGHDACILEDFNPYDVHRLRELAAGGLSATPQGATL